MRIVFITLINDVANASLGFIVKDLSKAEALNNLDDVECLGVSFSQLIEEDYYNNPSFFVKKLRLQPKKKFFNTFFENRYLYYEVRKFLSEQRFDIVLFRYNIACRSLYRLVKKYSKRFVFEHNTFEETEHAILIKERFKKLPFSLKPGYFFYHLEGRIWPLFCERYYGNKIRKLALGGISVTKEIACYQTNRVRSYQNAVVTNGIKYQVSDSILNKLNTTETLRLFMLIGTGANWHGVDRLIYGMKNYAGAQKITVDIIGYFDSADKKLVDVFQLHEQIRFLGPIPNEKLDKVLSNHHISMGTLALHRKKLKEATPLKIRESLMRGFPVVIAYRDTDVSDAVNLKDVVLQLPADETPIDFEKIVLFYKKLVDLNYTSQYISDTAKPYIDYKVKAKQIVDFINIRLSVKN